MAKRKPKTVTVTGVVRSPYAAPGQTREVSESPQVKRLVKAGVLRQHEHEDKKPELVPDEKPPEDA